MERKCSGHKGLLQVSKNNQAIHAGSINLLLTSLLLLSESEESSVSLTDLVTKRLLLLCPAQRHCDYWGGTVPCWAVQTGTPESETLPLKA